MGCGERWGKWQFALCPRTHVMTYFTPPWSFNQGGFSPTSSSTITPTSLVMILWYHKIQMLTGMIHPMHDATHVAPDRRPTRFHCCISIVSPSLFPHGFSDNLHSQMVLWTAANRAPSLGVIPLLPDVKPIQSVAGSHHIPRIVMNQVCGSICLIQIRLLSLLSYGDSR